MSLDLTARALRALTSLLNRPLSAAALVAGLVVWSHLGSGMPVFHSQSPPETGWEKFRTDFAIDDFGEDGYFVRAVRSGYNLFYFTSKYGKRFTRRTITDKVNACADCHTPVDMAYGLVNSDRFDRRLGRRISFEERLMRCFSGPLEGFVPTLYDPTIRDLRALARAIAHHLNLGEGALRPESGTKGDA